MAYDTANTYETIELFGLTEKDAQLPIPEDHVLTDHIIRESFEALLGPLRGTGLEAEIEPLAHGLATPFVEKIGFVRFCLFLYIWKEYMGGISISLMAMCMPNF